MHISGSPPKLIRTTLAETSVSVEGGQERHQADVEPGGHAREDLPGDLQSLVAGCGEDDVVRAGPELNAPLIVGGADPIDGSRYQDRRIRGRDLDRTDRP